jgi:hypothetical protein
MGTNRIYTATHLELYGYQPGQYCHPLGILYGYQPGQYCHPLGILWVPTGSILPTHLELCGYQPDLYCQPTWNLYGYQPDQYCRVHNQESSLEANGPTRGPLGPQPASVGPTFQKARSKALSKDLPKSLLV